MIPAYQTVFGSEKGNCFAACIASILEVPLDTVPNFCADLPSDWHAQTNQWLAKHYGLGLVTMQVEEGSDYDDLDMPRDCHHFISAKTLRGDCYHCVVAKNGIVVHDPHPSGIGLLPGDCYFDFFVKML